MKKLWSLLFLFCSLPVFSQKFEVDTIQYLGDVNNFINIVILGDGYRESELSKFELDAVKTINALFGEKPFLNYRNYFNVFIISVPSNESGAALNPNQLIDNYYGSTFGYSGIERLLVPTKTFNIVNVLANNFPLYDQVIMIVNSQKYGGSGGWVSTSSTHSSANEIAFHELGHSFSSLADEYWAGDQFAKESLNMTQENNIQKLKWKNWYGDFDIGLYPHAESPKWYRPHQNCKMRKLGVAFCSVCTQAIVEKVHSLSSPIRSYYPVQSDFYPTNLPISFYVDLITPEPNSLQANWNLNGLKLAYNIDTITLIENDLIEGINTLSIVVEDTSELIRIDSHEIIHLDIISWYIENTSTGIGDVVDSRNDVSIHLFPNPISNNLHIKFTGKLNGDVDLEIVDLQGMVRKSATIHSDIINSINLEGLNEGYYIAKFYFNNYNIATRKILKFK